MSEVCGTLCAMSCFVSHTSVDCHNAYELALWWKDLLGYEIPEDEPIEPGGPECGIRDPGTGHAILFLQVPDAELPGRRIHFDLRPRERTQDEEIEWVRSHGGRELADRRGIDGPGTGWVVFADPEGNEFCVLKSPAERAEYLRGEAGR